MSIRSVAAVAISLGLIATADAQVALRERQSLDPLVNSDAFVAQHPDLRFRKQAGDAYERGDFAKAMQLYQRAAFYAEKFSQARVAHMFWHGEGTKQDRALAYVWMDLAAERGYEPLLVRRERYWAELNEAERERALRIGSSVFNRYSDDVAKPRLERELRRDLHTATGSRVANPQGRNMQVIEVEGGAPSVGLGIAQGQSYRAERYYDPGYWKPELYWQWHDKVFEHTFRSQTRGEVDVGELTSDDEDAAE